MWALSFGAGHGVFVVLVRMLISYLIKEATSSAISLNCSGVRAPTSNNWAASSRRERPSSCLRSVEQSPWLLPPNGTAISAATRESFPLAELTSEALALSLSVEEHRAPVEESIDNCPPSKRCPWNDSALTD